jgi:hypothetical protein
MAKGKRKLQEDATQPNLTRNERDALIELGLHLALRISTAQRLKLPKVRLEMIEVELAEKLLDIIRREIGHVELRRT